LRPCAHGRASTTPRERPSELIENMGE